MWSADDAEFTAFVEAASGRLLRTGYLITGSMTGAGELVQVALERAYRRWRTVRRSEPEAYVRRILVAAAIGGRRPRGAHLVGRSRELAPAARDVAPLPGDAELIAGLRALPAAQRAVLVLRYFDDRTETEAAAMLGLPVAAVRSARPRAWRAAGAATAAMVRVSAAESARLRQAFEQMCAPVQPPAGLAHRVLMAARRQRKARLRSLIAITMAVVVPAAAVIVVWGPSVLRRWADHERHALDIPVTAQYTGLAVGGGYLYLATGESPDAELTAYDRETGRVIRSMRVPATVQQLVVGPGGTVWLTFPAGPGGLSVWLLSADLGQLSSTSLRVRGATLVPAGSGTALVGGQSGVDELRMPAPGTHGAVSLRPVTAVPGGQGFAAIGYAALSGGIAVLQTDIRHYTRIVLAGHAGQAYEPPGLDIVAMTAQRDGLWVATSPQPTGPLYGGLIRLGRQLNVLTPRAVATDPDLRFATALSAEGGTVWVTTDSLTRPLFCFRFDGAGRVGPVTFVPTRRPPVWVAAAADTVYVGDTIGVTSYRVPRACS